MLNKAFEILSSSAAAATTDEDESRSYGIYLGNKLRQYTARTRSAVQHAFGDIIFRADQGMFEHELLQNPSIHYPNPYLPQRFSSTVFTPFHSPSTVFSGPNSDPLSTSTNIYTTPTDSTSTTNFSSVYPNDISHIPNQVSNELGDFQ